MSDVSLEKWEARLRATASAFPYPPTPDIVGAIRPQLEARPARRVSPQWAWAFAILVITLAGLLAVPQVRAGLIEFLQIGVVRIRLVAPTPTATPTLVAHTGTPRPPTPAPRPSATPYTSVLQLAGETTFEKAQASVTFPIFLPTYPGDLGKPDKVYLQDLGGQGVVLVWLDPNEPTRVRMSLHQFPAASFVIEKGEPNILEITTVNGELAAWTEGPYLLRILRNGREGLDFGRLITGHVLIWVDNGITYRLETELSLKEAVRIAESLELAE
jgi:hypothetical protein